MDLLSARLKAVLYLALNILSGTGIVFLNKVDLSYCHELHE